MKQQFSTCPACDIRLNAFGVQFQRCPCGWTADRQEWGDPDAAYEEGHKAGYAEGEDDNRETYKDAFDEGFSEARHRCKTAAVKHKASADLLAAIEAVAP